MSIFRLATLNVHLFRNPSTYECNIDELVSILKPYNLDLIACQEVVNSDLWPRFCQLLSMPYQICNSNDDNYFGNAIASRYPIIYPTYRTSISCSGELRSLLYCSLEGFNRLTFGVTHLDDKFEDKRLQQLKEFDPIKENIDILMGDLNALKRDDYSDEYYREMIVHQREKAHCENAKFDLTDMIHNLWNYEDVFKLLNPNLKDRQVMTSKFGSRIDYIYVQPKISNQWILTQCQIIDMQDATDHQAVVAEFQINDVIS